MACRQKINANTRVCVQMSLDMYVCRVADATAGVYYVATYKHTYIYTSVLDYCQVGSGEKGCGSVRELENSLATKKNV